LLRDSGTQALGREPNDPHEGAFLSKPPYYGLQATVAFRKHMSTALIVALVVIGIIVGTLFTLKSTTRMGMPSKDVLERAKRRSHEQDQKDKAE
jgi:hypothetical protein